jgi:hypothetical protein
MQGALYDKPESDFRADEVVVIKMFVLSKGI